MSDQIFEVRFDKGVATLVSMNIIQEGGDTLVVMDIDNYLKERKRFESYFTIKAAINAFLSEGNIVESFTGFDYNMYMREVRRMSKWEFVEWDDYFENGECPDCGESIPYDAAEGDECLNCGHVFWMYRPTDD